MAKPSMFQSREDYEEELALEDGLGARCKKLFAKIPNIPLPRFEMSAQVAQPLAGATLGGAIGAVIGSAFSQSTSAASALEDEDEADDEDGDSKEGLDISPMEWLGKGNLGAGTVIGGAIGALAGAAAGAIFSAFRKPPAIALPMELNPLRGEELTKRLNDEEAARRFQELCIQEHNSTENFADAILLQSTFFEKLLGALLLEPSKSIQSQLVEVMSKAKKDDSGGRILEDYYNGKARRTLGVTEICSRAIKYAIKNRNNEVIQWLHQVYTESFSRYNGESTETIQAFSSGDLQHFLMTVRSQYRNPLAHGDVDQLDAASYERWCRLCYGVPRLHQWWSLGISPELIQRDDQGWIGILISARRNRQTLQIKINKR
jgi:hypothetical protein